MSETQQNTQAPANAAKRRYIGFHETVGYILFDASKSFNIDTYASRFLLDVVKIDLGWQTVMTAINSVWDILNDSFIGVIVDKTRTRYGKFRPYLLAFAIPSLIFTVLYWLTPMFFSNDPQDVSKAVYWMSLLIIREGIGTFRNISETGLLATITPNPDERMGILTKSELFSSFFENIPEWVMAIMIDLVNNGKVGIPMRKLYVAMGVSTTLLGGAMAIYCFIVTRERVQQTIEKSDIKGGLKTIISNKPLLMLMLSDLLAAFTINTGFENYLMDVLGSIFAKTIITAPGALTYYLSFAYADWARRRFSTKQLWIFTAHFGDMLKVIVFFIGSIGGKGKNGLYRKFWVMVPAFMAQDMLAKSTYGIKKILPRELLDEAMDYCEWKSGVRTEGMTTAAKSMLTKIIANTKNTFQTLLLKLIGYDITAGFGKQSDHTKYLLFVMCTVVPALSGLVSIIPKFFYNIDHNDRIQMYQDLVVHRAAKHEEYMKSLESDADKEEATV